MIRTLFHATADGRFVEVNALVGSPVRMISRQELPIDTSPSSLHTGAYLANRFAGKNKTYCIGTTLESEYMRNTNNDFVHPETFEIL